jgi:hypothetical protein
VNAIADTFDRLALIDRSFQIDRPGCGRFDLDGRRVRCTYDDGEWIRLSVPIAGSERDLIERQGSLLLPVKIATGPMLIAEMPLTASLASTFVFLRSVVHQALALVESSRGLESSVNETVDVDVMTQLCSTLEETPFTWDRNDKVVSTKVGTTTVVAKVIATTAVLRANVVRLTAAAAPSLDALTHFLLAVNASLRFVRGTFARDGLVQEVALPIAVLTPTLLNCAVIAVTDSLLRTKRAYATLADRQAAEQYLEFHQQRKDAYADTHS